LVTTSDLQRNGASGVENNYVAAVTHNLTANMKTPKPQKIRLIAQNPRKIKAALKSWVDATGKIDSDPLKLDEAPAWVEKAYLEVIKVIMPSKKMPGNGDLPLELLGEFIGRLQAFGKLYGGEIPMGPEQKAELERLEKLAASQPKSKERTVRGKMLVEDLQARVEATNQAIPNLIKAALDSSHEDALKFQKGLLRGMNLAPDELTAGRVFQRHTKTYWVLGLMWRSFSKCRSVAEVHRILCQAVGEKQIGSLKHFESRIAKKIGMKFGRGGRPPKLK
jgi:hypothetical protein